MNEAIRMHYLEAMGVDTFVPRKRFINAPEATRCLLPKTNDAVLGVPSGRQASVSMIDSEMKSHELGQHPVQTQDSSLTINPNSSLSSVLADIGVESKQATRVDSGSLPNSSESTSAELGESLKTVTETEKTDLLNNTQAIIDSITAPASETSAEPQPANLYLCLWHTASGMLVLDESEPGDALPTEALLSNILSVNGLLNGRLPSSEVQRWPVPGAVGGDPSWQGACDMMRDFLDGRNVSAPIASLLLCGESATKAVLGADFDHRSACFSEVSVPGLGIPAVVLPSLKAILYKPELKKGIWRTLAQRRA